MLLLSTCCPGLQSFQSDPWGYEPSLQRSGSTWMQWKALGCVPPVLQCLPFLSLLPQHLMSLRVVKQVAWGAGVLKRLQVDRSSGSAGVLSASSVSTSWSAVWSRLSTGFSSWLPAVLEIPAAVGSVGRSGLQPQKFLSFARPSHTAVRLHHSHVFSPGLSPTIWAHFPRNCGCPCL